MEMMRGDQCWPVVSSLMTKPPPPTLQGAEDIYCICFGLLPCGAAAAVAGKEKIIHGTADFALIPYIGGQLMDNSSPSFFKENVLVRTFSLFRETILALIKNENCQNLFP